MNYQQSNWLMDTVMPQVDNGAFKIIAAVARQSLGYQYSGVTLSVTDFQELTGMSRPTVINNIQKAVNKGFIRQEEEGQGFSYWPIASKEILLVKYQDQLRNFTSDSKESLPVNAQSSKESLPPTSKESLPDTSSPKEDTNKDTKELSKENPPLPPKGKTKREKFDPYSVPIPQELQVNGLSQKVHAFISYRINDLKKPYKSPKGVNGLYNELKKHSADIAEAMIDNAMAHEWLFPYELKPEDIKRLKSSNGQATKVSNWTTM